MSSLENLVAMGFPEEEARSALEAQGFDLARAVNVLLGQPEEETAHDGSQQVIQAPISQYDLENGRSACTCISLEASLFVLEHLDRDVWTATPEDVMNIVNVGVVTYEAVAGAGMLSVEHTSVSEVLPAMARYRDGLAPATARGCHQGLLGSDKSFAGIFAEISSERQDKSRPVAVAITKPPETVVAFLPPEAAAGASPRRWVLFDSHPRPHLGLAGASIRSFDGEAALVSALNIIFPVLGAEEGLSVMASMYNMLDCTPVTLTRATER